METEVQIQELTAKVEDALKEIRPMLEADGGGIALLKVAEDGTVFVKLGGACAGCPMSQMTLSQGVEARLKELVPEVKKVIGV